MLTKLFATAAAAALILASTSGVAEARRGDRYADCGGASQGERAAGAIAGAIIGGVIGNQAFRGEQGLGTAAGVILGGIAGSQLAASGDSCDQYYASYAYDDAFNRADPYERVNWNNPRSGNYGYIEPADYYQDRRGRECRNYEQEIYINGRRQYAEGVACRDRNGSWRIIE